MPSSSKPGSENPIRYYPAFISPLSEEDHARIGRIAILWGQIEFLVDCLIPELSGLTADQLDALDIRNKPIGSKVSFLRASTKQCADPAIRAEIDSFCSTIHATKVARNHVFHGVWGLRADHRKKRVFPAARKDTEPQSPFPHTKLPRLERDLCECSRLGTDAYSRLTGSPRMQYGEMYHFSGEERRPEWLTQWQARNPLGDAALDHSAKEGQLPRLADPYSRK